MVAAGLFRAARPATAPVDSIRVDLFGSLALTGKGHATDRAVALGLLGCNPATLDPDAAPGLLDDLGRPRLLSPPPL